jgi:Asp-tRNA(Asn)/Glu-tRNA(Gln) amidotransferase A subunit family amidase
MERSAGVSDIDDVCLQPAVELARLIREGELSPVDLVAAYLDRIERLEPAINAFVTVLADDAREQAKRGERAVARGETLGPLHGVPVAVKDAGAEKRGVRHTSGSLPLRDNVSSADSLQVERIEAAGAIVIGKTNTPEFGHRGTTDNKLVGPTSTPFARGWNAGGSSGGSAAAAAAGLAAVGQGSDGGGSVRIPASLCGCVGLIATWGRIPVRSRPDAFAAHTPFIHLGALARTVSDAALLLSVLAGPDTADPGSLPSDGFEFSVPSEASLHGLRIGYVPKLDVFPVAPEVDAVVRDAVAGLEGLGASVDEATLGLVFTNEELVGIWKDWTGVQLALGFEGFLAEGIDLLGDHRDELSPYVVEMVERGRSLSALTTRRHNVVRSAVFDCFARFFETYDLLVSPTLAVASIENDEGGETVGPAAVQGVEVDPLLGWCLTYPTNFAGLPAVSLPAGFTPEGFPVGLQAVAPRFRDDLILRVGTALEVSRPWAASYERCSS